MKRESNDRSEPIVLKNSASGHFGLISLELFPPRLSSTNYFRYDAPFANHVLVLGHDVSMAEFFNRIR